MLLHRFFGDPKRKENILKKFALIGYPLGHSLSPLIHRELMRLSGIDGTYELKEISPEDLENKMDELKKLDGFNVTIPHKMHIIPFLDKLNDRAALYGAVNTVKLDESGSLGCNTDCFGFLRALEAEEISLSGRVLICGAGGVSSMFACEAAAAGAEVTVAARNIEKAKLLADDILKKLNVKINITDFENVEKGWNLIVNGTPVGMFPHTDACVLPCDIIASADAVFDAIYNPSETVFLRCARENNVKGLNGLSMLVWQAAVAQEIWNGVSFSREQIDEVIAITERKSGTL